MRASKFDRSFPDRKVPDLEALGTMFPPPLSRALGLTELERVYRNLHSTSSEQPFFERALETLDVKIESSSAEIASIPEKGPVVVVANHPFGALDGLIAGALAVRRHSNVRVLANQWLTAIPNLRPWLLPVDVFGDANRAQSNAPVLKSALTHLRNDGLLILFPAGIVSHFQPVYSGIFDPPWNRLAAVLSRKANATVVPMFFEGHNSALFQVAGLLHPTFRTLLLPREVLRRRATCIQVRVGQPLKHRAIAAIADDVALTAWFRLRTYDLAAPQRRQNAQRRQRQNAITGAVGSDEIEREINGLGTEERLVQSGRFRAYIARAGQIPRTLYEIGRLRETTFRAAGEGTGEAVDLDRFDRTYRHLFVYDDAEKCLVGAYRIGFCDELLRREGVTGLYTSTLFKYESAFIRSLSNTLELGRSFVRADYQRSPLSLALLWRGIGEVLARNPDHVRLMGPVSISGAYNQSARRLMISYLESLEKDIGLKRSVRARRPPRERLQSREVLPSIGNVRQLGRLVAELDAEQRGIPVLLERYLELGGRVLGLNVDPKFGNCVDALIVVDVPSAPKSMLRRFLGTDGHTKYLRARDTQLGLSA